MRTQLGVRSADSRIDGAGKGLFAVRAFQRYELIAPYDGEVVSQAQLNARYPGDAIGAYALKKDREPVYIDAACQRHAGSIVNGARRRADANVEFMSVNAWIKKLPKHVNKTAARRDAMTMHRIDDDIPNFRLWVVARKHIDADEELLAHYGPEYDLDDAEIHRTTYQSPKKVSKTMRERVKHTRRRLRAIE